MKVAKRTAASGPKRGYLDGQMLIAMPTMRDARFSRTLIYICAHSFEGAMGIVINQPASNVSFSDLLVQLEVIPAAVLALGYASWAPKQLETEIQENSWLHCAADSELIFGNDVDGKYERALKK